MYHNLKNAHTAKCCSNGVIFFIFLLSREVEKLGGIETTVDGDDMFISMANFSDSLSKEDVAGPSANSFGDNVRNLINVSASLSVGYRFESVDEFPTAKHSFTNRSRNVGLRQHNAALLTRASG